jgi:hypothetical protein
MGLGHYSIWHWLVVILMMASPLMGVVRGVERGSIVHTLLSFSLPLYGLVYFFAAKNPSPRATA